jgi:hypothetical protein
MKLGAVVVAGLIVLGIALGLGGTAVPAIAAPPNPCGAADGLLKAGNYVAALAAYSAVTPAGATCAQQGTTAAGALLAANELISRGQPGPADDDIAKAADADPMVIPQGGVLYPAVAQHAITLAETLQADGSHQQAVQVLLFVIDNEPGVPLDPAATAILAPPGESFWTRIRPLFLSWPGFTSLVTFALLVLLVRERSRRRLHLQPFALDGAASSVDPEAFRGRVRDELRRLAAEAIRTGGKRRPRIDIAGPYDDRVPLAALIDQGGPQAQFIKALLDVLYELFPRLSVPRLVSGTLLPDATIRMSIQTLDMVERDATKIEYEKLDVRKLGVPQAAASAAADPRYDLLALPAAAWVIFRWYKRWTLGGTRDFESFSLFALGRAWEDLGRLGEAEQCYLAALGKDKANLGAKVNLARLRQRNGPADRSAASADDSWVRLLEEIAKATRRRRRRLQWHQSRYLLSLGLADFGGPRVTPQRLAEVKKARRLAVNLALRIEKQRRRPRWISWVRWVGQARWVGRGDSSREFFDNLRGPALALAASQLIPDPATSTVEAVADAVAASVAAGAAAERDKDGTIIRTLKEARRGRGVQPDVLATVAEAQSPRDDEVAYNLYRYQHWRRQACRWAITEINRKLSQSLQSGSPAEREKLSVRKRDLEAASQDASAKMGRYREQLSATEDSVLRRRFSVFQEFGDAGGTLTRYDLGPLRPEEL